MPFTNYQEVLSYGAMVHFVTNTRYMPPWRAQNNYGQFDHNLRLSDLEIQQIKDWKAAGFPAGELPAQPDWKSYPALETASGPWDMELSLPDSFEQFDIYFDQYQVFRLDPGLEEDRWVEAIEFVPGDSTLLRYAAVAINRRSKSSDLDTWDPRSGYSSFGWFGFLTEEDAWFSWSLGEQAETQNTRRLLPAGSELLLYLHYGPSFVKKFDRSRLRLRFASTDNHSPVLNSVPLINPLNLQNEGWSLPPNQKTILHGRHRLQWPIRLFALEPRALLYCQSWEVFARLPNGRSIPILKIPEYDFHWRRNYRLAEPLDLPAGTELLAFATYDNQASNPNNPLDPPQGVEWGFRLFQEQFAVYFDFSFMKSELENGLLLGPSNQISNFRKLSWQAPADDDYSLSLFKSNQPDSPVWMTNLSAKASEWQELNLNLTEFQPGVYYLCLSGQMKETNQYDVFVYWPEDFIQKSFNE